MYIEQQSGEAHNDAVGWIEDQLSKANSTLFPGENFRPFTLLLFDDEGKRRGGVVAFASWNWLVIDSIVVDSSLRNNGFGRLLMNLAEQVGYDMGCRRVQLQTFQAEAFYGRLGYEVAARLADYPPGSSYVTMTKNLTEASATASF